MGLTLIRPVVISISAAISFLVSQTLIHMYFFEWRGLTLNVSGPDRAAVAVCSSYLDPAPGKSPQK